MPKVSRNRINFALEKLRKCVRNDKNTNRKSKNKKRK